MEKHVCFRVPIFPYPAKPLTVHECALLGVGTPRVSMQPFFGLYPMAQSLPFLTRGFARSLAMRCWVNLEATPV